MPFEFLALLMSRSINLSLRMINNAWWHARLVDFIFFTTFTAFTKAIVSVYTPIKELVFWRGTHDLSLFSGWRNPYLLWWAVFLFTFTFLDVTVESIKSQVVWHSEAFMRKGQWMAMHVMGSSQTHQRWQGWKRIEIWKKIASFFQNFTLCIEKWPTKLL